MEIELSNEIIDDADSLSEAYIQLKAFRRRHRISYTSYIILTRNAKVSDTDKLKFKELFSVTTNLIKFRKKIRVVKTKTNNDEVLIDDLNEILSHKAIVIIENEHQDLDFILTCITAVSNGPDLSKLFNTFWQARGAGGCGEIPKLITKCYNELSNIPRILVVHDSDKYNNAYEVGISQQNIINCANKHKVNHIMLSKREIENYIPTAVLESIFSPDYPKIKYIKCWNREQRDFFDMKMGFMNKCQHTDVKYNNIYHNLAHQHIDEFRNSGFGEDISRRAFTKDKISYYSKQNLDTEDPNIYTEFDEIKNKLLDIL